MTGSGHRLLPHTADMGIEAWAEQPEGLFVEAASGLKELLFGEVVIDCRREQAVRLEAQEQAELLVAWLNEILYQFEIGGLTPAAFRIEELGDRHLVATILGDHFDPGSHPLEHEIKAVTYHQVILAKRPDTWYGRVYVDL